MKSLENLPTLREVDYRGPHQVAVNYDVRINSLRRRKASFYLLTNLLFSVNNRSRTSHSIYINAYPLYKSVLSSRSDCFIF